MKVLQAVTEVYGKTVGSSTWYDHYKVWRHKKIIPEIASLIETSIAAGHTAEGEWEKVLKAAKAHILFDEKKLSN